MIIRVDGDDHEGWMAKAQGQPAGVDIVGCGRTMKEAIGDLVYQWAGSDDSVNATERIDLRICTGSN